VDPSSKEVLSKPQIRFKHVFWTTMAIVWIFSVLERVFLNWIPEGQLEDAKLELYREQGLVWLQAFQLIIQITARLILLCVAVFFVTMCRVAQNWLIERIPATESNSRVDWSDAPLVTGWAHKAVGIFGFTIIVIVHVGSAFLPLLQDRSLNILTEGTNFPWIPPDRHIGFDDVPGKWSLRFDDLLQGGLGLITAVVLLPLTIYWSRFRRLHYNATMWLHFLGAFIIFWLIYRVPEHIRTYAFMWIPIGSWIIDFLLRTCFYRITRLRSKYIRHLDDDYAVLGWRTVDQKYKGEVGDMYYLNDSSNRTDLAHPFTHLTYDQTQSSEYVPESTPANVVELDKKDMQLKVKSWTHCKVRPLNLKRLAEALHTDHLRATIVRKHPPFTSFSNQVTRLPSRKGDVVRCQLQARGPYRRVYRRLMRIPQPCPYLIVATGSGVVIALDFVLWASNPRNGFEADHPIHILFATHSSALLEYVSNILLKFSDLSNLHLHVHLTSADPSLIIIPTDDSEDWDDRCLKSVFKGRFNVRNLLQRSPKGTQVYFCGSSQLFKTIKRLSKKNGFSFYSELPYS
jgi:ferredoxin-NADP reductase